MLRWEVELFCRDSGVASGRASPEAVEVLAEPMVAARLRVLVLDAVRWWRRPALEGTGKLVPVGRLGSEGLCCCSCEAVPADAEDALDATDAL